MKAREWTGVKSIVYEHSTEGFSRTDFNAQKLGHVVEHSAFVELKQLADKMSEDLKELVGSVYILGYTGKLESKALEQYRKWVEENG